MKSGRHHEPPPLPRALPGLRAQEAAAQARHQGFPRRRADLETSCDCPDWRDPCKHVAAVHYVLDEALDRDPFLLFELRGRGRDQVLGAIRSALGAVSAEPGGGGADKPRGVVLERLTSESYTAAPAPLPTLSFSFEPPPAHAAVLRQLGAPGSWNGDAPVHESLTPLVEAAAVTARRLALRETESAAPAPVPAPSSASRPAATKPKRPRSRPR